MLELSAAQAGQRSSVGLPPLPPPPAGHQATPERGGRDSCGPAQTPRPPDGQMDGAPRPPAVPPPPAVGGWKVAGRRERVPYWGCQCGENDNWACRSECRKCGRRGPRQGTNPKPGGAAKGAAPSGKGGKKVVAKLANGGGGGAGTTTAGPAPKSGRRGWGEGGTAGDGEMESLRTQLAAMQQQMQQMATLLAANAGSKVEAKTERVEKKVVAADGVPMEMDRPGGMRDAASDGEVKEADRKVAYLEASIRVAEQHMEHEQAGILKALLRTARAARAELLPLPIQVERANTRVRRAEEDVAKAASKVEATSQKLVEARAEHDAAQAAHAAKIDALNQATADQKRVQERLQEADARRFEEVDGDEAPDDDDDAEKCLDILRAAAAATGGAVQEALAGFLAAREGGARAAAGSAGRQQKRPRVQQAQPGQGRESGAGDGAGGGDAEAEARDRSRSRGRNAEEEG